MTVLTSSPNGQLVGWIEPFAKPIISAIFELIRIAEFINGPAEGRTR